MSVDQPPEVTLGEKIVALLEQCSPEEQALFLTMIERAAEGSEVEGFGFSQPVPVDNVRFGMMMTKVMANSHEMKKSLIGNLPR